MYPQMVIICLHEDSKILLGGGNALAINSITLYSARKGGMCL